MLAASKAVFLEYYLAVSTWILNESSTEYHEKTHQRLSFSGVWFGRRAIQMRFWNGRKWAVHPWLLLTTCSNSQRKTHLIAKIRHFELQILNSWENLRISFDKACAELSSMQMMRVVFTRSAVVHSPAGG